MSDCRLEPLSAGLFALHGQLDFDSVVTLLANSERQFDWSASVVIDLQAVSNSNSAGLALLLEWMCLAAEQQQKVRFRNLPLQLTQIAQINGLQELLPLES
ncbi:MAG: STAS domain-containing protein [Gammaproteobacteria bacterium]|nr:STAS domain-containing protein [Gammaproteobacteria bacterium]